MAVSEESGEADDSNDNAFMDYVDTNVSAARLRSNVSAVKLYFVSSTSLKFIVMSTGNISLSPFSQ